MAPQDSFIEDEDDCCPLCVEEFDLTDKSFRPCPCGYQVCQFCFNNIKNNMNGLCPACRRPYDEKTIQFKVVTPEEFAKFKADVQRAAKRKAAERQKEAQKREVESLNRKHLAGLRVVQKNLVYVIGLNPTIQDNDLLQTLRGDKYFGQYGKIIKIVVSKNRHSDSLGQSLGVYVTFANDEDAATCIRAVNGSMNGDRQLRAQLGTTKYCSAYLRNETCTNKQCMFLHEPGDNDESYSRQELSSMNGVNTQNPVPAGPSGPRRTPSSQAPVPSRPLAAAAQAMARDASRDGSEGGDGSALPTSASWGSRVQQRSRRGSQATASVSAASPAVSLAMPAPAEAEEAEEPPCDLTDANSKETTTQPLPPNHTRRPKSDREVLLYQLLKCINDPNLSYARPQLANTDDQSYPPLFDQNGGAKRQTMHNSRHLSDAHIEPESAPTLDTRSVTDLPEDDAPESGSLQLGGEPEEGSGRDPNSATYSRRASMQMPINRGSNAGIFGPPIGQGNPLGTSNTINGRTLTQHQQAQLAALKSAHSPVSFVDQLTPTLGGSLGQLPQTGHNRQSSRFAFANENQSAKSSKMMNQAAMLSNGAQPQTFYSSMPGPPPGLKPTGTPPIGGMLGQGHSFGGAFGNGAGFAGSSKENDSILRDMLRNRGPQGGVQGHETVDLADPSILQARMQHQQQNNAGAGQGLFGGQAQEVQEDTAPAEIQEASFSVDDLVADTIDVAKDARPMAIRERSTPRIPSLVRTVTPIARIGTPSVPPGLGLPFAQPAAAVPGEVSTRSSRILPTSAPFTPRSPAASVPATGVPVPPAFATETVAGGNKSPLAASVAKKDTAKDVVQKLATDTGLSKAIASQSSTNILESGDFPALQSSKKPPSTPAATAKTPSAVKASALPPVSAAKAVGKKADAISSAKVAANVAPQATSIDRVSVPETQSKNPEPLAPAPAVPESLVPSSSAFPPLPAVGPVATANRPTPKTLRLIPATKNEPASMTSATPPSSTSTSAVLPARQPSIALAIKADRPSTPTSELFSESASITSASLSRANSPPPTKVGSAPLRVTSKSMQKKQRREAQKDREKPEPQTVVPKDTPEVEVAPLMGRKKKQKKEKPGNSTTRASTPAASRAPSPSPANVDKRAQVETPVRTETQSKPQRNSKKPERESEFTDIKEVPMPREIPEALQEDQDGDTESMKKEKALPSPSNVFRALLDANEIDPVDDLLFLKSPLRGAPLTTEEISQPPPKLTISPDDMAILRTGQPVHKSADAGHRILLTPNGDCVRNLTAAEEERYMSLQKSLADETGPAAFAVAKSTTNAGFSLISGRAVPNGPPPYLPQGENYKNSSDPFAKLNRDEALAYINQYVLPGLNANPQIERALNASVHLEPGMLPGVVRGSSDAQGVVERDAIASWAEWTVQSHTTMSDDTIASYAQNAAAALGFESEEMFGNSIDFGADPFVDGSATEAMRTSNGAAPAGTNSATASASVPTAQGKSWMSPGDVVRESSEAHERILPMGSVSLLSLSDAEKAVATARKEAESLERRLIALVKKNRKILLG